MKCKTNLHIDVEVDEALLSELGGHYNPSKGVKAFSEYIDEKLYETLSEMKLQEVLWDDESAKITYDNGYFVILKGGEKIATADYLKNFSAME